MKHSSRNFCCWLSWLNLMLRRLTTMVFPWPHWTIWSVTTVVETFSRQEAWSPKSKHPSPVFSGQGCSALYRKENPPLLMSISVPFAGQLECDTKEDPSLTRNLLNSRRSSWEVACVIFSIGHVARVFFCLPERLLAERDIFYCDNQFAR